MLDVFRPLSNDARRDQRVAYRHFLDERDGTLNVDARTLSLREASITRYQKPLPRMRELNRSLFDAQYEHFDTKKKTSVEMLLLLTMVKVNAAEAYGVNQTYDVVKKRAIKNGDDLELLLLVEETYHTKILLSAAGLYGMNITAPYTPHPALRALIGGIANTPEFLARPLTLAGEILGTLIFLNLLHVARKHLAHDPELRDTIEERIIEVLVDEIGHISFNRMCLGAAGLTQTRMLLPVVARGLSHAAPELSSLGVMPSDPTPAILAFSQAERLPEEVRKQAFFA